MTTYTTAADIINGPDTQLQRQVTGALLKLAEDIRNEAPSTAYHPVRRRWAERVRRGTAFAEPSALVLCAFNAGIRSAYKTDPNTITDSQVEAVLAAGLADLIAETL